MIPNNQKTSLLIPSQLPAFIRDDPNYANFVLFLQAYYEWLETTGNVSDVSKNILNYSDIDNTTSDFSNYFYNEFLSYFPQDVIADRNKVVKIAKELYQAKGTPASFKFLFRILYNLDVDFFFTQDVVLKASSGKWYVTNSLNVLSSDTNFLSAVKYFAFGQTTQSLGIIEIVQNVGTKTQIFISNIQRQFQSGEYIRIIDANRQDVYFLNGQVVTEGTPGAYVLTAKIVGQVNKLTLTNPGTNYQAGDPVVFYGGLTSTSGIGAAAQITGSSSGSIQSISVVNGGYGYRLSPNTLISVSTVGSTLQPTATVFNLNPTNAANATFLPVNYINTGNLMSLAINSANYSINTLNFPALASCNANTSLANVLTFISIATNPISSLTLTSGGAGIQSINSITAKSYYPTSNSAYNADLAGLGILAPIQILNGGYGYRNNDTILITGGPGFGALANVTSVNPANGNTIISISYVYPANTRVSLFPLGGLGYSATSLPTATVSSANAQASGAVLSIPGILGAGATFQAGVTGIGKITGLNITNAGQDYSSIPSVSLAVQDVIVSGVNTSNLPVAGDIIFQSPDNTYANSTYYASFDSILPISISPNPTNSLYRIRLYNYNSSSALSYLLKPLVDKNNGATFTISNYNVGRFVNGILTYGDGKATATATFTNGLFKSQGQYLDSTGQPSGDDVIQSEIYNNFTYEILVQKEIEKYRKTLLGLLHPSGMKVLGRFTLSSANNRMFNISEALYSGHTFANTVGTQAGSVMVTNSTNVTNNIVTITGVGSANIGTIFFANTTTVRMRSTSGDSISGLVTKVNVTANQITLQSNTWLTFTNVATVRAFSGTNAINILSLSGLYTYYNGGVYSNTSYPLMDIVKVNDVVLISNNTSRTVSKVDYINNIITVSSNISANADGNIPNLTVIRPFVANAASIQYFGPVGIIYIPELTTESGITLTTEDGTIILLG